MNIKDIKLKKEILEKEYNKNKNDNTKVYRQKEIEKEYNILTCREIINDYLYYGYGIKTFIENDYNCAKKLEKETINRLFKEQTEILGNL